MDYTVDLTELSSRAQLHERLRAALPLPAYYGNNLDALYDVLAGLPPFTLTFRGRPRAEAAAYTAALRRLCARLTAERPEITITWEEV